MRRMRNRIWSRAISGATIVLFALSPVWEAAAAGGKGPAPDVSGTWEWNELAIILAPDEVVMAIFGVAESEGPVMRVFCHDSGQLTIQQDGQEFDGFATQNVSCTTAGGQIALTPPLPPFFAMTGRAVGAAVHFDVNFEEAGIACPYEGSLTVKDGVATELNATGRCVTPFPFHPNMTKNLTFNATRQ